MLLDVVVTDHAGRPIGGLTKDDFTAVESGETQKIASFEASSADSNGVAPRRISARNLILLDELNVTFDGLAYARDQIALLLDRNAVEDQPTALMAVGPHGLIMIEDFTRDSKRLKEKLAHLPAVEPNPKGGPSDPQWVAEHGQSAMDALTQIARANVGSGYCLNVVWVTSGFEGVLYTPGSNDEVDASLHRVTNMLMSSRMRLYTIDPAGVMPLGELASKPNTARGPIQQGHLSAAGNVIASTGGDQVAARGLLAHMTSLMGGVSYYGRDDVDEAIGQAFLDGSSTYVISYSPSNTTFNGDYRTIQIGIDVKGATARTRQG